MLLWIRISLLWKQTRVQICCHGYIYRCYGNKHVLKSVVMEMDTYVYLVVAIEINTRCYANK